MMKKYSKFVANHPRLVLLIMTLLLVISYFGYKQTGINYDILTYLPKSLNSTEGQEILDKQFNNASTGMLIFEGDDREADALRDEILRIEGVEDVISKSSIVGETVPKDMLPDKIKDAFYAEDSTLMIVKFKESASSMKTMSAIDEIRKLESKPKYLSGISALVKDTKDVIDRETPTYVLLAVVLAMIVLSLTNESTIIPFVFILTIGYAVAYNFGTNFFLGEISYITKAIAATLQLAVTMDYSIFLYRRYVEEKAKRETVQDAMSRAIENTVSSIFASSLTTFAGFIVLALMELGLGKDIGLVMSKGVLIGLLTTVSVLPSMLLVTDKLVSKYNHRVLLPSFDKLSDFSVKHKKTLFTLFLVLFIPAIYGSVNAQVYYNLDKSLPKNLDSIVALNKMKKDYNMASTHFIVVKEDMSDVALNAMIEEIEDLDGINSVITTNSMLGTSVPDDFLPQKLKQNFVQNGYKMLMINSEYQTASDEVRAQIHSIRDIMKNHGDQGYLTGEAVLTDDLTLISNSDFTRVSIVSVAMVFLILVFVFKSFAIPVILIGAIELAIQINMGLPFYMHQTIPFVTSIIIGVIQLGSTVDYSILMTDRFLYEYKKSGDVDHSLRQATRETSKSIVISALSFMAATVGVGLYSNMEIVSTICTFLARGAIISMLVILFMLPALLSILFPFIKKTSKGLN